MTQDDHIFCLVSALRAIRDHFASSPGNSQPSHMYDVAKRALEEFEGAAAAADVVITVWTKGPAEAAMIAMRVGVERVIAITPDPDPTTAYGSAWVYVRAPDVDYVRSRVPPRTTLLPPLGN